MGKGKIDRTLSNSSRRRRKEKRRKFVQHLIKHPKYWNTKNPTLSFQLHLIFVIYMISIAIRSR